MANTGKKIILKLCKFQNPGNIDLGIQKPNVPTDSDYQPPVIDTVACPIVPNVLCPVPKYTKDSVNEIGIIEFSVDTGVLANTNVATIRVKENLGGETHDFPITGITTNNFFYYEFINTGAGNHSFTITYLNSVGTAIQTCGPFS